jgi:diacylglycerol O-acyltransferase
MRRVRPDDDFQFLTETDQSPMQIGSLQYYAVPAAECSAFTQAVRHHLAQRLAQTPLLCVLQRAPQDYDSAVWLERAGCDLDYHVTQRSSVSPMSRREVYACVEQFTMERIDLSRPPFRIQVLDNLASGGCAVLMKVHHALVDGIGFQTILQQITDAEPNARQAPVTPREDEAPPSDEAWLAQSGQRFEDEAPMREAWTQRRTEALAQLAQLKAGDGPQRAQTPTLKLSGPTSTERVYATLTLPLERMRAAGKRLGATVNDVFLTIGGGALRRYLLEIDDLPADPIVITSARSYRQPEHGDLGNRIVALHPQIGTHIEDPVVRLRAIQASMAAELGRSRYDEMLLDAPEVPFGPKTRREAFAKRLATGRVLPGNITLSNVPGPAEPRYLAGYRQTSNYPTPILGSGRFLNVTMRRNADNLDMGIMADAAKIHDLPRFKTLLAETFEEFEARAATAPQ